MVSVCNGEVLHIDLDRPRQRLALADDPQYNHYRSEVLKFLYERQKKPGENNDHPQTETPTSSKPVKTAELRVVAG